MEGDGPRGTIRLLKGEKRDKILVSKDAPPLFNRPHCGWLLKTVIFKSYQMIRQAFWGLDQVKSAHAPKTSDMIQELWGIIFRDFFVVR